MTLFRVSTQPVDNTTQQLAGLAGLRDEAKEMIPANLSVADALDRLAGRGLFVDAIRLLGFTLPARELAWWGVLGGWHSQTYHRQREEIFLLRAIMSWVHEPSPAALAIIREIAPKIPTDRDVHQLALMVVGAEEQPDGTAYRQAGVCSLFLNCVQRRQKSRDEFYADLLAVGRAIASNPEHWSKE